MTTLHFVSILVLGFAVNDFIVYYLNLLALKQAFKPHETSVLEILDNKKDEFDDSDSPVVIIKKKKVLH